MTLVREGEAQNLPGGASPAPWLPRYSWLHQRSNMTTLLAPAKSSRRERDRPGAPGQSQITTCTRGYAKAPFVELTNLKLPPPLLSLLQKRTRDPCL